MKKLFIIFIFCFNYYSVIASDTLTFFAQSTTLPGSSWKYFGNGTNIGTSWKTVGFNDMTWATGNSELGFGDGDENTVIGTASNAYTTYYFRKVINITNPAAYTNFLLQIKRDDGIAVYVNGTEVYLNNLVTNASFNDFASADITDDGETILESTLGTGSPFVIGNNTIAVEVHQRTAASSDITFDMQLIGVTPNTTPTLTRGPYLQMGGESGINIRWRTDIATTTKANWGIALGNLPNSVTDNILTTEHEITLTGLTADTKYFYSIGSTNNELQAGVNNYFQTLPLSSTNRKVNILALGDCGVPTTNQANVKNAFKSYVGNTTVDAMILLGDNAYSFGLDNEYTTGFFNPYKDDLLKYYKLYPAPGNHDYGNSQANSGVRNNAYYNSFTMPTNAQLGGVASNTEAYYSYDVGPVHLISLDSYGKENGNSTRMYDTTGAQVTWLKADLEANTKPWVVVYFHHPPYTKTSHNSDTESELILIRENFVRILERYGVDLVLSGHSHGYERSYLLKNLYKANAGDANTNESSFSFANNSATTSAQNALYDGTANSCPYTYNIGRYQHGTMYIVSGSAGQLGGTTSGYPHNAMFYSNEQNGGSFYISADSNRLDAKFVSYTTTPSLTPIVRDQFTIFKQVNKSTTKNVSINEGLTLSASWTGTYFWPHNGETSKTITVNTSTIGTQLLSVKDAELNNCLQDNFQVNVNITLPVKINNFGAEVKNSNGFIKWQVTNETKRIKYILEKSTNGNIYKIITSIGAKNDAVGNYSFTDYNLTKGENYYRLKIIDENGKEIYASVRLLTVHAKNLGFTINSETKNQLSFNISCENANGIMLLVSDSLGRTVYKKPVVNNQTVTLKLNTGLYLATILQKNKSLITKKIICN